MATKHAKGVVQEVDSHGRLHTLGPGCPALNYLFLEDVGCSILKPRVITGFCPDTIRTGESTEEQDSHGGLHQLNSVTDDTIFDIVTDAWCSPTKMFVRRVKLKWPPGTIIQLRFFTTKNCCGKTLYLHWIQVEMPPGTVINSDTKQHTHVCCSTTPPQQSGEKDVSGNVTTGTYIVVMDMNNGQPNCGQSSLASFEKDSHGAMHVLGTSDYSAGIIHPVTDVSCQTQTCIPPAAGRREWRVIRKSQASTTPPVTVVCSTVTMQSTCCVCCTTTTTTTTTTTSTTSDDCCPTRAADVPASLCVILEFQHEGVTCCTKTIKTTGGDFAGAEWSGDTNEDCVGGLLEVVHYCIVDSGLWGIELYGGLTEACLTFASDWDCEPCFFLEILPENDPGNCQDFGTGCGQGPGCEAGSSSLKITIRELAGDCADPDLGDCDSGDNACNP